MTPRPRRSSGTRQIRGGSRRAASRSRAAGRRAATRPDRRRTDAADRLGQLGAARADQAGDAEHLAVDERSARPRRRDSARCAAARSAAVRLAVRSASHRLARRSASTARPTISCTSRSRVIASRVQRPGIPPVPQHDRTVGQRFDFLQAMRDVDDGGSGGPQIPKHAEQPFGVARAEARRRLVEDQQPRVHREGARDRDELLLRGGQLPQRRARREAGHRCGASCRSVSACIRRRSSSRSGPPTAARARGTRCRRRPACRSARAPGG